MNKQELEEKYGHLKDKFFGLYTGQPVAYYSDWLKEFVHYDPIEVIPLLGDDEESYLQLKPLSSITDEDWDWIDAYSGSVFSDKEHIIERFTPCAYFNGVSGGSTLIISDYLRSKGYALPFMVIPVDQQIAMGWCKVG